jgi:hypothetical protein
MPTTSQGGQIITIGFVVERESGRILVTSKIANLSQLIEREAPYHAALYKLFTLGLITERELLLAASSFQGDPATVLPETAGGELVFGAAGALSGPGRSGELVTSNPGSVS